MKELYLLASIFIGLMCTTEAMLLYMARGKIIKNKLIFIMSTVEFVWAVVTFYVLFKLNFSNVEYLVPVLFTCHTIFDWIYSVRLSKPATDNPTTELKDIQIPRWYTLFALSFGLVFTLVSFLVYRQLS